MTATLLHELLDRRSMRSGNTRATSRSGRTWNYAELWRRSQAAASWLHHQHVRRGDRVLIVDHNDMETLAVVFGASRIGAMYTVVSHRITPYLLRHIVADSCPRLIVGSGEAIGQVAADVPTFALTEVPDRDADAGCSRWPVPIASDPVSLIYTSGSTALPKAVVSTHQQVTFAVDAIAAELGYREDDSVFCCLPLSFDYGLYQAFLCCATGAALMLGDETDAGAALPSSLASAQASVLPLVPSLGISLCLLLERSGASLPFLRMITSTGAPLIPSVAARLRARIPTAVVVAMFGLTECKRVSIAEPDLDLARPGSAGRALPGTEVVVADAGGRPLPPGEVGEFLVKGPHVMAGYWNSPDQTAARFRRDYLGRTTLHTGDYGRTDNDGYLYVLGRRDDIYKQNGFRVSTTEVEAAALDIPGVERAAALPPREDHGARLAVSGSISLERLLKELRLRLEPSKIPADCLVLDALPLTTNGKSDRRAIAGQWGRAHEAGRAGGLPAEALPATAKPAPGLLGGRGAEQG